MIITIREQIRNNAVALTSLLVALSSLGYNTWRNERTEHNRNIRTAAFEILTKLAEFERVVFLAHYDHDSSQGGNPRVGWTYVIVLQDLAAVMPGQTAGRAQQLQRVWRENWEKLGGDDAALDEIDAGINGLRAVTMDTLRTLR